MNQMRSHSTFWLGNRNFNRLGRTTDPIELAKYKRSIGKFVKILTKENVPVTFCNDGASRTDGKKVYISSEIDQNNFDSVVGLALHEGSHIVLTDFELLPNFRKNANRILWQRLRMDDRDEWIDHMTANFRVFKAILNYVEDRRIDYYVYTNSPGYKPYYEAMYERYFNSKEITQAFRERKFTNVTLKSYMVRIINFLNDETDLNALPDLKEMHDLIFDNVAEMQTTDEAFVVAFKIYKMIVENVDEAEEQRKQQQQQQKQQQQQSSDDESDEGQPSDSNSEGESSNSDSEQSNKDADDNRPDNDSDDSTEESDGSDDDSEGQSSSTDSDEEAEEGEGGEPGNDWDDGFNDPNETDEDEEETEQGSSKSDSSDEEDEEDSDGEDAGSEETDSDEEDSDEDEVDGDSDSDSDSDEDEADESDEDEGSEESETDESDEEEEEENLDEDFDELENEIEQQEQFLDGDIDKEQLDERISSLVDDLADADIDQHNVEYENQWNDDTNIDVAVVRGWHDGVFKLFPRIENRKNYIDAGSSEGLSNVVKSGLKLGKRLGKKLQIRNRERTTTYNRRKKGKLDKRRIHALGAGQVNVFNQYVSEQHADAFIHLSIDGSSSMSGEEFNNSIESAVAMAKMADMTNIDIEISLRYTSNIGSDKKPVVWIVYNSKKDSIKTIKQNFKYLRAFGTTPEGLCFASIMDELPVGSDALKTYFINYSDGEPMFRDYDGKPARQHTRSQVKNIKKRGYTVLSFFLTRYKDASRTNFEEMYGKNASFIDPTELNSLVKTLQKMFLKK